MTPHLVVPSVAYRESFFEASDEFEPDEQTLIYEREAAADDFDTYLAILLTHELGQDIRDGWVPASTRWLVTDETYIGTCNIRHELNDFLLRIGGHIGYAIRPSYRRRGYGTLICKLALGECRGIGIERVLITCDDDNLASRRVIEANGGELEDVVPQDGTDVAKRRYWIDLSD